jgi:hypothetical protein
MKKLSGLGPIIALIFTTAFPIEGIRNKIGNIVFTAGHSGPTIRKWVMPNNPQTVAQMLIRAAFKSFTEAWRSLSGAQITAWNNAGATKRHTNTLGTGYFSTGKSLFVGWNVFNSVCGGAVQIDDYFVPTKPPLGNVEFSALAFAAGAGTATLTTDRAVPANGVAIIYGTPNLSQGVSREKGKYKIIKIIPAGTAAGAFAFGAEYVAIYGTMTPGQKVFVGVSTTNDNVEGEVEGNPMIKGIATVGA